MGVYGFRSFFMKSPSNPIHRLWHSLKVVSQALRREFGSPRSTLSNSMSLFFPSQVITWIETPGSGQNSQSRSSDWALRRIDRKTSENRAVDAA